MSLAFVFLKTATELSLESLPGIEEASIYQEVGLNQRDTNRVTRSVPILDSDIEMEVKILGVS